MASGALTACNRTRTSASKFALISIMTVPLLAAAGCSCSFSGGPVEGRVRDIDTGQPIANAIVVVRWNGFVSSLVDGQSVCFHTETAISDQEGKYRVPLWFQEPKGWLLLSGNTRVAQAYQRGYQSIFSHSKDAEEHPDDVYMKRFSGSDDARFDYIAGPVFLGMSCDQAGASYRNLFPLFKAGLQEAKGLAHSQEQQRILDHGMRRIASESWLAPIEGSQTIKGDPFDRLPNDIRKELE